MNTSLMFSSEKDDWATPLEFYKSLNNEFNFNLDPCATDENHKCKKYFTKEDNGLLQNWEGYNVFLQSTIWESYRSVGRKGIQ